MSACTFGPVSRSIIATARYVDGVELVRDCGEGLTLGDAGEARRRARVAKSRGDVGTRAYFLAVARELRTRRVVPVSRYAMARELHGAFLAGKIDHAGAVKLADAHGIAAEYRHVRNDAAMTRAFGAPGTVTKLDVPPSPDDPDGEICRHCHTRADWHDASDGACPDGDGPHPYSVAADQMTSADCDHGPGAVATCGGCGASWCGDCDPAPSALCHYCHGRGYSTAPRVACSC